jgi:hypothetical protein
MVSPRSCRYQEQVPESGYERRVGRGSNESGWRLFGRRRVLSLGLWWFVISGEKGEKGWGVMKAKEEVVQRVAL